MTVQLAPLPAMELMTPFVTYKPVESRPVTGSLKISEYAKLFVAVMTTLARLSVIDTVGGKVSTEKVTVLLVSAPSIFALPAASVKTPLATLTTPLALVFAVGVKVAV